ncbi:MAG: prepilin peptidase [Clostridia bacterium]|nr:prepilin peptidase [Clostridia bacterium]
MALLVFVLGLLIGSFLNVCIFRIPNRETIIYGTSRCPHCRNSLGALDLIPVISYLVLKGNCRFCQSPISWRYPLVELLTGLIFYLGYISIGELHLLIKYLVLFSLLIIISFIDIDRQLIPNQLVLAILVWGIGWQLLAPELSWQQSLLGAILGGGILLLIAVISKGGMGGGDIKLMFAAGLVLGGRFTVLALFIACVIGAFVGGFLLATGIKKRKEPIPFGPFLSLGIFVASLWGEQLIQLYLTGSGLR